MDETEGSAQSSCNSRWIKSSRGKVTRRESQKEKAAWQFKELTVHLLGVRLQMVEKSGLRLEASGREQVGQHLWANHAFKTALYFTEEETPAY